MRASHANSWVYASERHAAARCSLLLAILALVTGAGCASTSPVLSFDVDGGEAWTFTKPVSGGVAGGDCERVLVRSEMGATEAVVAHGRFHALIPLREGANTVHAECLASADVVASSAPQKWSLQLREAPKSWIRLRAASDAIWLDAGRSEPAPGARVALTRFAWSARASNPAPLEDAEGRALAEIADARIELAAPRVDGEYFVTLRVTDALGRSDESGAMFRVQGGRAYEVNLATEHPDWVDGAVVYGAVPFFFERGFDGLRERLDEIAALGATAVWISPVTRAASGDFGYAVADHFRLRPDFGDEEAFRALVQHAHALGLKVLLNFVPNHFSTEHRYFTDAQREGERSPYYEWFDRDELGAVTHYFDWGHLQNLEYDNPEVQNHVIEAFAHWVRAFDVDGFRVDASWAVRERAPEFWPRWRAELKRIEPDLFLLAEASARDPYYFVHGFDAAYDWTDKLGEWAWGQVFDEGQVDVERLRRALINETGGADALTFRFLNNNDTGERFIARHGVALTKLAATLLFTLPGAPLIYNGDEVGASFEPYDEGPPIDWSDPHGLSEHYRRLAALRRQHAALRGRVLELLETGADDEVLAYRRPAGDAREDVYVFINFGERPREVHLPKSLRATRLEELLSGGPRPTLQAERLHVGARQALVLRAREGR